MFVLASVAMVEAISVIVVGAPVLVPPTPIIAGVKQVTMVPGVVDQVRIMTWLDDGNRAGHPPFSFGEYNSNR